MFPGVISNVALDLLHIIPSSTITGRKLGKVAVSWLEIAGLGLGLAARILSHKTATLSKTVMIVNHFCCHIYIG